ncbi:MAG: hypothetical protein [Arizlama microvirus]|nr:MAG: hypothetical protein [Arizlama microvirus]
MTHEQLKDALNEYSQQKEQRIEHLIDDLATMNMETLIFLQYWISQTMVFSNAQRSFNIKKSENDVKELI